MAPSAPGLAVDLVKSPAYREALTTADLAITDSGFMVMLWRLFMGESLPRHSGLKFIRAVLARPELKAPGAIFWVMPSAVEADQNAAWLAERGFPVTADDVYLAPHYRAGEIIDDELVRRINTRRPRVVMLAIGGGVQERVGLMLRNRITEDKGRTTADGGRRAEDAEPRLNQEGRKDSRCEERGEATCPAILCLGAAIAFLSGAGDQARIPMWADRMMLGLFIRFLGNPRRYWRRYVDSLPLAGMIRRYRDQLPEMKRG